MARASDHAPRRRTALTAAIVSVSAVSTYALSKPET